MRVDVEQGIAADVRELAFSHITEWPGSLAAAQPSQNWA